MGALLAGAKMPRQCARGRAREPVAHRLAMQKRSRGGAIEDGIGPQFAACVFRRTTPPVPIGVRHPLSMPPWPHAMDNSCSAPRIYRFAGVVLIWSSAINVNKVSRSGLTRGDSQWVDPATKEPSHGEQRASGSWRWRAVYRFKSSSRRRPTAFLIADSFVLPNPSKRQERALADCCDDRTS